jgi:CheY-like chemotaxis protein/CHASE3 domain sensor protein
MKFQWTLQNKIMVGSLIPITLVLILGYLSYGNIERMKDFSFWVDHTHEVLSKSTELEKLIIDMETGERGFLITGKISFLEPYNNGVEKIKVAIEALSGLVNDNPAQVGRMNEIEILIKKWITTSAEPEIKLRKEVSAFKDTTLIFKNLRSRVLGKEIFDQIRTVLDNIDSNFRDSKDLKNQLLISETLLALVNMETGQRGYLLSGIEDSLQPYIDGQNNFERHIKKLEGLRNANIKHDLKQLLLLKNKWFKQVTGPEIKARRAINNVTARMEDVSTMIQGERGKSIIDELRLRIKKFKKIENDLLAKRQEISLNENLVAKRIIIWGVGLVTFLTLLGTYLMARLVTKPVHRLSKVSRQVMEGDISARANMNSADELGTLGTAFDKMLDGLAESRRESENKTKDLENQNWIKSNVGELADKMHGEQTPAELAKNIIQYITPALKAQIGAIYLKDDEKLKLVGSYAYNKQKFSGDEFRLGEGLIGQAALEKKEIILTQVPDDYIKVNSGLGEVAPKNIFVIPFSHEEEVKGVIELGSLNEFGGSQMEFLRQALGTIAVNFYSSENRYKTKMLLNKTQAQAEELESQQEEMRATNEELESQQEELRATNEELESQQEEMRATNEELESQSASLQKSEQELLQKQGELAKQNSRIQNQNKLVEEKARQLELASKYKSEFLANMSHELRTPLNSLLILSKLLSENKDKNLTEKQLQFANTIHDSGSDLLNLISDILDLSKVEAGKVELHIEEIILSDLATSIESNFKHVAEDKGISLQVESDKSLPASIKNDRMRLDQVIKNLLSNAFKFTSKGGITVKFQPVDSSVVFFQKDLKHNNCLAISVTDTGTGISEDNQGAIFEAFQQEDGSTSRKFGGTGLGLSISREFIKLMKGEIHLESQLGHGSTFTVYIPKKVSGKKLAATEKAEEPPVLVPEEIPASKEGRDSPDNFKRKVAKVTKGSDSLILIVEDDPKFANILLELAQENGFEAMVASDGETGLKLIEQHQPAAIILDIGLPGMDGLTLMDKIREHPKSKNIPVHFLSAMDKSEEAMEKGAAGFLSKPVSLEGLAGVFNKLESMISKRPKNLLLVEDDKTMRTSIVELLKEDDVGITSVALGQEALDLLETQVYDCMVLDLGLSDMSGFDLLDKIHKEKSLAPPPVIIYTGKDLSNSEQNKLNKYSDSIIIKGAKSLERLQDEAHLFLHSLRANNPDEVVGETRNREQDSILKGKRVLVADDDMRNVFALTNILESREMKVLTARNGKEALNLIAENPGLDIVLMDIMMPEMDGIEAIELIRKDHRFRNIPIIALTAKAMMGDREKCIKAGASDYQTKPVDTDKLLSKIKVWLSR